jgi:hypothetical protein
MERVGDSRCLSWGIGKNNKIILRFLDTCFGCLSNGPTSADARLLDWRYFYEIGRVGHSTCGIARRVMTTFLRCDVFLGDFLRNRWAVGLETCQNPSTLGFCVEQMILGSIALNGCLIAGEMFDHRKVQIQRFNTVLPDLIQGDSLVLYVPTACNYHAVDAIMVSMEIMKVSEPNTSNATTGRKNGKKKPPTAMKRKVATVLGIQITIAAHHSDSERNFFASTWPGLATQLKSADSVRTKFLLIKESISNEPRSTEIAENTIKLKDKKVLKNPAYQRIMATVDNISEDVAQRLVRARELLSSASPVVSRGTSIL